MNVERGRGEWELFRMFSIQLICYIPIPTSTEVEKTRQDVTSPAMKLLWGGKYC